jgi:hypothetical protein
MLVRLNVKLAEMVNGVDLSHCEEGDVIELPVPQARMLIAERWAEEVLDPRTEATCEPAWPRERTIASDQPTPRRRQRAER